MIDAKRTVRGPHLMTLGPGTLFWCRCGQSAQAPMCDGHHERCGGANLAVKLRARETVAWCGCRQTRSPPDCDGTHRECWTNARRGLMKRPPTPAPRATPWSLQVRKG